MKKQERAECWECGLEGAISNMYRYELYDTPWDDEPRIAYLHKHVPSKLRTDHYFKYLESCSELLDDPGWADFRYFLCDGCYRMVCAQNPRNGWHSQVRYLDDGETSYCLRCYEEHILENGIDREELENGKLPGMFFSNDNHEALDAGYRVEIYNQKVGDPKPIIDKALELIDSGHEVIIGYESMAIGGLEGYVTLFSKEAKHV